MKRFKSILFTLMLAHAIGSYCSIFPTLLERFLHPDLSTPVYSIWQNILIYLALPGIMPLYLIGETFASFPNYHYYLPEIWASYTIPFIVVCFVRRGKSPVIAISTVPVLLTLIVTIAYRYLPDRSGRPVVDFAAVEHKRAPDFTLASLDGTTRTLSQEKGHVVLIDFWFIGCPHCLQEFKQLTSKLAADDALRQRGLRVWTINVGDNADDVRQFMSENHYDFPVLFLKLLNGSYFYPNEGYPTTYLIGRDGKIRKVFTGFAAEMDKPMRDEIEAALD